MIDEIAKSSVPRARPPHSKEAVVVDWDLWRELVWISRNDTSPMMRIKARIGARKYRQYWLDRGYAGCNTDPEFRRRAYGNWCGAGVGGGAPIDAIDEACMRHDLGRQAAFARIGVLEAPVYS